MAHNVRGLSAPVANQNIPSLYSELVVGTADTELYISPIGGVVPEFPLDDGEIIQMVGTDAADVGNIKVVGLGPNKMYQSEVVALNGLTPVNTTKLFSRINDLFWQETTAFLGIIYAQEIGGARKYLSSSPPAQLSVDGVYSIAADRRVTVEHIYAAIVRDAVPQSIASINVYYRPFGFAFRRPFRFAVSTQGDSSTTYDNTLPVQLTGPIDIYLSTIASGAGAEVVSRVAMRTVTI